MGNEMDNECIWIDDSIPSYLPAVPATTGNKTKSVANAFSYDWRSAYSVRDIIWKIDGWNRVNLSWSQIWRWKIKNDYANKLQQGIMPLSAQEVAKCYTFKLNTETYPVISVKKGSPLVYMYVHGQGQLFEPTRTSRILIPFGLPIWYKLKLSYNRQLSRDQNLCTMDMNSFDACIHDYAHKEMMRAAKCRPLFLDLNETICQNFSDAQKAYRTYSEAFWNSSARSTFCTLPCHFYNVEIERQTYSLLLQMFSEDNGYLYRQNSKTWVDFHIPSLVEVAETQYSYEFPSLVAELGGWLGLFIGTILISPLYLTYIY